MSSTTATSEPIDEAQAALAELHRRRKRNAEAQRRLRERKKKARQEPSPHGQTRISSGTPSGSSGNPAHPVIDAAPPSSSSAEPDAWEVWSSIIFDEARTRASRESQAHAGTRGSGFFAAGSGGVGSMPPAPSSCSPGAGSAPPRSPPPAGSSSAAGGHSNSSATASAEEILATVVGTNAEERKALLDSHGEMALFFSATPLRGLIENTRRLRMPLRILADMDACSNVSESWLRWKEPKLASSMRGDTDQYNSPAEPSPASRRSDGWPERAEDRFLARMRAIDPDDFMTWDDVRVNMHPCHEQLVIEHRSYLDALFPLPEMRSRCLLQMCTGEIREDDICALLLEQHTTVSRSVHTSIGVSPQNPSPQQAQPHPTAALRRFTYHLGPSPLRAPDGSVQPGWYLWGDDATDPDNWEFSESFVRKFPGLLDQSILRRTNWWRAKRGLPPLSGEGIRR